MPESDSSRLSVNYDGGHCETLVAKLLTVSVLLISFVYLPAPVTRPADFVLPKELLCYGGALLGALVLSLHTHADSSDATDLLLAGVVLLILMSAARATNGEFAIRAVALPSSAALYCMMARRLDSSRTVVLATLVLTMCLLAVVAHLEAAEVVVTIAQPGRGPAGTIGNRNQLAHLLVMMIPVIAGRMMTVLRWQSALQCGIAITVMVSAVVLSRSRVSWIALSISSLGLLVMVYRNEVSRLRQLMFVTALTVGSTLAFVLPSSTVWRTPSPYSHTLRRLVQLDSGSGYGRLRQYHVTATMIADFPISGIGAGNWPIVYAARTRSGDPSYDSLAIFPVPVRPSSDWLGMIAESGVGVLLLSMVAVVRITRMRLSGSELRERSNLGRRIGLCGLLLAFFAAAALDSVLLTPTGAAWSGTLLGLCLGGREGFSRPRIFTIRVVAASLVAPVFFGFYLSVMRLRVDRLLTTDLSIAAARRAVQMLPSSYQARMVLVRRQIAVGDCVDATPHLDVAHRLFPSAPAPRLLATQCASPAPPDWK